MNPTRDDLARLRAALDYPDDTPAPDVPAIIARGRRARARRTLLAAASVAAATVVAAVLLVPTTRSGAPLPAPAEAPRSALAGGPPPAVLVSGGAPVDEAPTAFDPLTRTLDIGWVPDGLDGGAIGLREHEQTFSATDAAYVNGGPDIGLVVTVLSRGRGIDELPTGALGLPRWAQPRPTDPVGGRPAECLSDPTVPAGTCTALRWQYAPDAWAQVSYAGSAGPTPQVAAAVARRVAESVALSAGEPVRLPFSLSGWLGGTPVVSTWVGVSDDVHPIDGTRWSAEVEVAPPDPDTPPALAPKVSVSWTPGGSTPGSGKYGEPNTEVDGHPAMLDEDEVPGSMLVVWGVRGTTVALFDVPDLLAAFGDVAVVDDPTDPAGWAAAR